MFSAKKNFFEKQLPVDLYFRTFLSDDTRRFPQRAIEDIPEHLITPVQNGFVPPPVRNMSMDPKKAQAWVDMHRPQGIEHIAQKIIDGIRYYNHKEFVEGLINTLENFHRQFLGEDRSRPYIIVLPDPQNAGANTQEVKSFIWVLALALPHLAKLPEAIVYKNQLAQYLTENPHIENCVLMDDASFSGNQMGEFSSDVNQIAQTIRTGTQLWVVVPFMTDHAASRLKKIGVTLATYIPMQTIDNTLSEEDLIVLCDRYDVMTRKAATRMTLTYFEHHIPDFQSTFPFLANGTHLLELWVTTHLPEYIRAEGIDPDTLDVNAFNANANKILAEYKPILFIPKTVPPYKLKEPNEISRLISAIQHSPLPGEFILFTDGVESHLITPNGYLHLHCFALPQQSSFTPEVIITLYKDPRIRSSIIEYISQPNMLKKIILDCVQKAQNASQAIATLVRSLPPYFREKIATIVFEKAILNQLLLKPAAADFLKQAFPERSRDISSSFEMVGTYMPNSPISRSFDSSTANFLGNHRDGEVSCSSSYSSTSSSFMHFAKPRKSSAKPIVSAPSTSTGITHHANGTQRSLAQPVTMGSQREKPPVPSALTELFKPQNTTSSTTDSHLGAPVTTTLSCDDEDLMFQFS